MKDLIKNALEAKTLGQRSFWLGQIERRCGPDCPFTGYAFMIGHPEALRWAKVKP